MLDEEDAAHFLSMSDDGVAGGDPFGFSRDASAAGSINKDFCVGVDNGGA